MKTYEISEKTLKELIKYLQTKPYSEVSAGIVELSQLKEIKEKDKKQINVEDKE